LKPQYWPAPYSKEGKTQREKKEKKHRWRHMGERTECSGQQGEDK
jgi:hypothetical protein